LNPADECKRKPILRIQCLRTPNDIEGNIMAATLNERVYLPKQIFNLLRPVLG
jgi:hypothetical protein